MLIIKSIKILTFAFAMFPIAFSALSVGILFGMLFLNRLPKLHHPLLKNIRFADVTHDKFFVVIEADDPKYEEEETHALLKKAGSKHIEVVNE